MKKSFAKQEKYKILLVEDGSVDVFAVVEKRFEYKGHDCICTFCRYGYRCGFVSTALCHNDLDIECHCGQRFIGVLPEEYSPKEPFYIGFDCGHVCDGLDTQQAYEYGLIDEATKEAFDKSFYYLHGNPVRDIEFVVEQCKKIADQLEELGK